MTNEPATAGPESAPHRPGRIASVARWLGCLLVAAVGVIALAWATLAVYYSNLPPWCRPAASAIFIAGQFVILLLVKPRSRKFLACGLLWAAVLVWWLLIPPSNNRDWQRDLALLPGAERHGNQLTVHNIRNCDYRSETAFDVRYYDRTFDLDRLRSVDLFLVRWGSPHIAHTMFSFGFEGDQYLCISIETRKEKGEAYSTVKGFFKQYELTYVVADERDLVKLRTNYRGEQVHLYRLQTDMQTARAVLMDYFATINSLRDRPEWYNALTSNCTTNIRGHTRPYAGNKPWNWRLLLNGHLDELIYERGAVDRSLPLADLNARSLINQRASAAGDAADFSRRIREGLPGMQADAPASK